MGLAASQARFLTLTARKSNIEYQGQQINQQRMVLANKSADVVNKMMELEPPTPPSSSSTSYYKIAQNYTNKATGRSEKIKNFTLEEIYLKEDGTIDTNADGNTSGVTKAYRYKIDYTYMQDGETVTGSMYTQSVSDKSSINNVFDRDDATGHIIENMIIDTSATASTKPTTYSDGTTGTQYGEADLLYGTSFDSLGYNDAINQYDYQKYKYDKAIDDINAETAGIQAQDKKLELKLKQLDSEHTAVQTEVDAVKAVIQKNVESTFKTFAS